MSKVPFRKPVKCRQHCRLTLWNYASWNRRNTHHHQSIRTKDPNNHSDTETGTLSNQNARNTFLSNWHVSKSHSYWVLKPRSIALCNFVNTAFRREQSIVVKSIWELEDINPWYCLRQTHARVWSFLGELGQIAQSNLYRKALSCFVRRNRWTCITMQQSRNFPAC